MKKTCRIQCTRHLRTTVERCSGRVSKCRAKASTLWGTLQVLASSRIFLTVKDTSIRMHMLWPFMKSRTSPGRQQMQGHSGQTLTKQDEQLEFWGRNDNMWVYLCICYFSVSIIKHHGQKKIKNRRVYLGLIVLEGQSP